MKLGIKKIIFTTSIVGFACFSTYGLFSDTVKNLIIDKTENLKPLNFAGYELKNFSEEDFKKYLPIIKDELRKNIADKNYKNTKIKKFNDTENEKYWNSMEQREDSEKKIYWNSGKRYSFSNSELSYLNGNWWTSSSEDNIEFLKFIENSKKEFEELRKKVKIDKEDFDEKEKNKIPYNVEFAEIKKIVKNLPESTAFKKYWIDISKDNDHGKIKIDVYARNISWNKYSKFFNLYTEKIASDELTGFKSFSYKTILSERTIRVFTTRVNWLGEGIKNPSFNQYKDGYKPEWANAKLNFAKVGSALVLDKDISAPNYYIATNKHVLNSISPTLVMKEGKKHIYTNHYKIQDQKNTTPMHVSPADVFFNWTKNPLFDPENGNLKGYITFGSENPISNDKDTDNDFLNTIFEFKDKKKDIIKSIKLINDFSYPNVSINKDISTYRWSTNKSFLKLNELELSNYKSKKYSGRLLDDIQKNSADFVILKVEFADEKSDPFKDWWNLRPTRIRALDENDLFNKGSIKDEKFISSQEYGTEITNEYWSAGYSAYKNECDQEKKINPNKQISIKKKVSENIFNKYFWTDYSKHNIAGKLTFTEDSWIQISGASGSPVFDKNGNVLGLLWGGSVKEKNTGCDKYDSNLFNMFFWFGHNLKENFLNVEDQASIDEFKKWNISPFNLITDRNSYSFFSEIWKKNKDTKTYLTEKYPQNN